MAQQDDEDRMFAYCGLKMSSEELELVLMRTVQWSTAMNTWYSAQSLGEWVKEPYFRRLSKGFQEAWSCGREKRGSSGILRNISYKNQRPWNLIGKPFWQAASSDANKNMERVLQRGCREALGMVVGGVNSTWQSVRFENCWWWRWGWL